MSAGWTEEGGGLMFDDFNRVTGEYKAAVKHCQEHPSPSALAIVNDLLADVMEQALEVRDIAAKELTMNGVER